MTAHHARRAISAGRLAVASVVMGLGTWMTTATSAQAPQPRASVDTQAAQYQSGSTSIDVYLARPRGATRRPAVIVLHDDLGANSRFRELAQQFAEAGFVALAPHLPSRAKVAASEPGRRPSAEDRDRRPLVAADYGRSQGSVRVSSAGCRRHRRADFGRWRGLG